MRGILRGFVLLFLLHMASPAAAEKRVALVIGNAAYANAPRLANPANDASAMAELLRKAGFDVVEARNDLGANAMRRLLREFSDVLRDTDVALVFYAGHGMEVNGVNYLIPVDAVIARDVDVEDEAVSLDRIMRTIEPARRLQLVILDSCRDNPFVRSMKRTFTSRSVSSGHGDIDEKALPRNTLIAYAQKSGLTADDGSGSNSPYTTALLKHLAVPGLDIELALRRVRDEVLRATKSRQEPFKYGSLGGAELPLVAAPRPPESGVGSTPDLPAAGISGLAREAAEFWPKVEHAEDPLALKAYIESYGETFHGRLARNRLGALEKAAEEKKTEQALAAQREQIAAEQREKVALLEAKRKSDPAKPDSARAVKPGSGQSFRDCPSCPEMVVVPSGSFIMGSLGEEQHPYTDESPLHRVAFARPFAVGKFEVTFAEWDACVAGGGCGGYRPADNGWGRDRQPVINVSWENAKDYVGWLSSTTGRPYRLPSEAEWEYAARAGTKTPFPWGKDIGRNNAACGTCGSRWDKQQAAPVGSFKPNAFGLHDMIGNLREWVDDCVHHGYAGAPNDGSAWTNGCRDGNAHIIRNGSWFDSFERDLRSAYRCWNCVREPNAFIGFRVARTVP